MAAIVFDGGTVQNVWIGTPASRLSGFQPDSRTVGQRRTLLATGAPRVWAYRDADHTASFTIRDLANTDLALCVALQLHLSAGGEVEVQTGDATDRIYAHCVLAPGTEAEPPKLDDPQALRYSMTFTLLNLDGAPFVAVY